MARSTGRGFTYLGLLFGLAIAAAGLAATGQQWRSQARQEREAELLFRGLQLARALQSFARHSPPGAPRAPGELEQLLQDRRHDPPMVHLRRVWTDPFTGRADWQLVLDADGAVIGFRSASPLPLRRRSGLPPGLVADDLERPQARDWLFTAALLQAAPDGRPP